ncbi:DUF2493 domain-containing protein [Nocardiopsis eucommiae]|uniref:DUF2493 domain-containing protein n=1 Tax=Nocardiopsis eucommiae TaxID=2831970 RepID=A0A975L722_9ACTN|nr:DUF2493 domain-containing protein [Nocardiopsis eucommiae]
MRIIVTGGRHYTDREVVAWELLAIAVQFGPGEHITLVHGDASGADRLAASVAARAGWTTEAHPARWKTEGRAAGPFRNQRMADAGADLCIAFPGGQGTADMVRRAKTAGIPVRLVA